MNTLPRYLLLIGISIISLHLVLTFTRQDYGRATSVSSIISHLHPVSKSSADGSSVPQDYLIHPNTTYQPQERKANAAIVIIARDDDINGIIRSVRDLEDRFNRKYRYPYVVLSQELLSNGFNKRISVLTSSKIEFGVIPPEHWRQPDWIDEVRATAARNKMMADNIIYGDSVPFRNACRFKAGFLHKHPLLQKYRWYWRVEPDVRFPCNVDFDPFLFLEDRNKIYGFTISMYEFEATIPSLWGYVKDFMKEHPEFISSNNALGFISDDAHGEQYNRCHFWSNFEIADMEFWRGPAYTAFFDYLESTGGFYYERWGDAPVHSMALSLFARKDQIHFFEDIAYDHNPFVHCPRSDEKWTAAKCTCNPNHSFDYDGYSCMRQWDRVTER